MCVSVGVNDLTVESFSGLLVLRRGSLTMKKAVEKIRTF